MTSIEDEETGHWRMFVLDEREAQSKKCSQIIRIHLMQDSAVSFGFVERRVTTRSRTELNDQVTYYVFGPLLSFEKVPTLREGMNIIEWLWQNRKERSSHE